MGFNLRLLITVSSYLWLFCKASTLAFNLPHSSHQFPCIGDFAKDSEFKFFVNYRMPLKKNRFFLPEIQGLMPSQLS